MKQFVVDYLIEACQNAHTGRIKTCIRDHHEADLLIEMETGRKIAVYVINRALRLPEIRDRYQHNTRHKIHTLFVIDSRMLPVDVLHTEPPPWMNALHILTQGRVYAYHCDQRSVTIRPVHIEWKWGNAARNVELGQPVQVADVRPAWVTAGAHQMDGTFATADFGEGAFWKKRDPNDDRQFSYSWHTWSFSSDRKSRTQPGQSSSSERSAPGWDAWDDFQRNYGDTAGYQSAGEDQPFDFEFGSFGDSNSTATRRMRNAQPIHYSALGLSLTGTLTLDDVKTAYRRKARENHPDMHPTEKEKYTARMAEINAAFEAISKDLE